MITHPERDGSSTHHALVMAFMIVICAATGCQKAEHIKVKADVETIEVALELYKAENGSYPTSRQGVAALVAKPTVPPIPSHWTQRLGSDPKDPWGVEYLYLCPGQKHRDGFDLFSAGPDRVPNTADDDWGR